MTILPEASMPARSIFGLAPQSVQYMNLEESLYIKIHKEGKTQLFGLRLRWEQKTQTVLTLLRDPPQCP